MKLYTVWNGYFGVGEKCLRTRSGDYVGLESGEFYNKENHDHSDQLNGVIVSVDNENNTGMLHLASDSDDIYEGNRKDFKRKYINCLVTLEEAHYADGKRVYRCNELNEYFSEDEVELL